MRIQKYLSQVGFCSRRAAEDLIKTNKIRNNGLPVTLGDRVKEGDTLSVEGKPVEVTFGQKKTIVIAYFKPRGVECTLQKSAETTTLADIDFGVGERVFPIGRLDKDSHGLLLLTNDGDLGNQVAHPSNQKQKEYIVSTSKPFDESFIFRMSKGVEFSPGKTSAPCEVKAVSDNIFEIVLTEGKNRQIRRMAEACDYKVIDLLRIRIGKIKLGEMKEGRTRILSDIEIKGLL